MSPDRGESDLSNRTALVLFGSESGNSQDVAEDLGRTLQRLRFHSRVQELDSVQAKELIGFSIILFVLSTTGQGEFPRNARQFWKSLLLKRLPSNFLEHLSFTVFGLGDSSYAQFNWAARKLQKRLSQLGAREIYPYGEADDQHPEGYDGTFLPWKIDLRASLLASHPLPKGFLEIPNDVALPPKIRLRPVVKADSKAMGVAPSSFEDALAARNGQDRGLAVKNEKQQRTSISSSSITTLLHAETPFQEPLEEPLPQFSSTAIMLSGGREVVDDPTSLREATLLWTPSATQSHPDGRSHLKEASNDPPADDHIFIAPPELLPIPEGLDAILSSIRRITPEDHWQDVRLLSFCIPQSVLFGAGCAFKIWPKNFPEDVQSLIDLQGWNQVADIPISFDTMSHIQLGTAGLAREVPGLHATLPVTLRKLLTHNLDINAIPRRSFFELIANFTDDDTHRERLLDFTNPFYSEEFFDYTTRPRRSILEVLHDFPSVRLPWADVTTIFPIIRPRAYSLASAGLKRVTSSTPKGFNQFDLLIALVKYRTVLKKVRHGLCSRYIAALQPGTVIRGRLEFNEKFQKVLNPSAHPERPALMIAPGTGIAPCRALLHERSSHRIISDVEVGTNVLIFGNRNRNADYFFKDELTSGHLDVKIFTAFSRDQKEKIYVQDVIRQECALIYGLLKEKAVVYVCGSSGNMPKAVKAALVAVMMAYGGREGRRDQDESVLRMECEEWLKQMEKDCEYIQETW